MKNISRTGAFVFICVLILAQAFGVLLLTFVVGANPAEIFSDGFESGDFSVWSGKTKSAASSSSVVSDVVHHGVYAAKFVLPSSGYAVCYKDFSGYSTVYGRVYIQFDATPRTGEYWQLTPQFLDSSHTIALGNFFLYNDAGTVKWALRYYTDSKDVNHVYSTEPEINTNTWYCLEVKVKIHATEGEVVGFIDGVERLKTTGLNNDGRGNPRRMEIGPWHTYTDAFTLRTDCVKIADTYIGPEGPPEPVEPKWLDGWQYRKAVTIDNTQSVRSLADFQVSVEVDTQDLIAAQKMQSDCRDIRFTNGDGTTILSHYIEGGTNTTNTKIWVRVPFIAASSNKTIYMYYGNSSKLIAEPGSFFPLSDASIVLEKSDSGFDSSSVHTLSVVENESGKYKYCGYYGCQMDEGIGLAWSNDLYNWVKYDGNPLLAPARWASVIKNDTHFNLFYTKDYTPVGSWTWNALATSSDGINFTDQEAMIPPQEGYYHGNSFIFDNRERDGKYYLFTHYVDTTTGGRHEIAARSATSLTTLDEANPVIVISSDGVLAAPSVMYHNGLYYLTCEVLMPGNLWVTTAYYSKSITSNYIECANSPILKDDDACNFLHLINEDLYLYYSHVAEPDLDQWDLRLRTYSPSQGKAVFDWYDGDFPKKTIWTTQQGSWKTHQNGSHLVICRSGGSNGSIYEKEESFSDFVYEQCFQKVGNRVYATWRIGGNGERYRVWVSPTNYELTRHSSWSDAGTTLISGTHNASFNAGYDNIMKIVANGANFEVRLNDIKICNVTDSVYTQGMIGLEFYNTETNYWDWVRIRKYTEPEPVAWVNAAEENIYSFTLNSDQDQYYAGLSIATLTAKCTKGSVGIANATISFEVDDPDNKTLFSWSNRTDQNGTATFAFLISRNMVSGNYTARATCYDIEHPQFAAKTSFQVVSLVPSSQLNVWFDSPDIALITRDTNINLNILNAGNITAYNVSITWRVPEGLEIISMDMLQNGIIAPGEKVTLSSIITTYKPSRYVLVANVTFKDDPMGSSTLVSSCERAIIFAYHMGYPVDLENMKAEASPSQIVANLTVTNYGDDSVNVTLICTAVHETYKLALSSSSTSVIIAPRAAITVNLTIDVTMAPKGEYTLRGILSTALPKYGGFTLTYKEETLIV